MVTGLMGKKLGMTRIYTESGAAEPVTVLEAGPCTVVQRKTTECDGYEAVQLGFGTKLEKRCTKPLRGHFAKAGASPASVLREFRLDSGDEVNAGDTVKVDIFEIGDRVDVAGISKGKGFQGVQKRWGFGGGPASHGSNHHREPGSIGMSADPSKVHKGKKLPGRMGNKRITAQNLEIISVDPEKNLILIRGSIPGANGGVVVVRKRVKGTK